MTDHRTTPSPYGTIFHRDDTALRPTRRCDAGHVAPAYDCNGNCVVCTKVALLRHRYGRIPEHTGRLKRWRSYGDARVEHEAHGGWLIRLEEGYGTTDNPSTIARCRSMEWLRHCDAIGCWDEVELGSDPATPPPGREL